MHKLKKILALDDILTNLHVIKTSLDSRYDVAVAKTSDTALKILSSIEIDLLLLDIEMPFDLSGFEFLALMKKQPRLASIPVIFVTSHSTPDYIIQAVKAGAADFIVKPIDAASLIQKIEKVLNGNPKPGSRQQSSA